MMSSNKSKSMNECLQLLIKELRYLQHDLESILRIDDFIHNKLINACQKISACQYACFKSSDSLTELINDLKSSIIIIRNLISSNSFFSSIVVIIEIFNLELENNIENIRIEEIKIAREKHASSVRKKNVDRRSIQEINAKKQNENSEIVLSIR
jgi:hypothetical protein